MTEEHKDFSTHELSKARKLEGEPISMTHGHLAYANNQAQSIYTNVLQPNLFGQPSSRDETKFAQRNQAQQHGRLTEVDRMIGNGFEETMQYQMASSPPLSIPVKLEEPHQVAYG